jgi:hypothetical protein
LSQIGNGDVNFVYIKATEAVAQYRFHVRHQYPNGQRVRYHGGRISLAHPDLHVGQQADIFLDTVGSFKGMLPPVVCLETTNQPGGNGQDCEDFSGIADQRFDESPMIYTSESYWKTYYRNPIGLRVSVVLDKPGNLWPGQMWPWAMLDFLAVFLSGTVARIATIWV